MRFRAELVLVLFTAGSTARAAASGARYSTRPLTLGQQTLRLIWLLFPELFHPAVRHGWFVADHFQVGVGISVRLGT